MTLLAHALATKHTGLIFGMLALTGVGTGIRIMPGTLHGVAYHPRNIASIVSLLLLAMNMGGALGLTVMQNIFNSRLGDAGFSLGGSGMENLGAIAELDEVVRERLVDVARRAIVLAFYAITAFLWIGLVAMVGMGNVSIGKREGGEKGRDRVWMGSYPLGVLMGRERGWGVVDEDGKIQPVEL